MAHHVFVYGVIQDFLHQHVDSIIRRTSIA